MSRPKVSDRMRPEAMESLRDRRGLDRGELANVLNDALGMRYTDETIRRWEKGDRPIPKSVQVFLESIQLQELSPGGPPPLDRDSYAAPAGPDMAGDTAPGPGPSATPQAPLGLTGAHARACEDLWEMIAMGLGMVGAATGSQALVFDGQIILQDKAALGAAYGRLAETNDTFRRMLVGMTEGGAWMQVALVTGTTVSKCWQAHQQVAAARTQPQPTPDMPAEPEYVPTFNGADGHAPDTPGLGY